MSDLGGLLRLRGSEDLRIGCVAVELEEGLIGGMRE